MTAREQQIDDTFQSVLDQPEPSRVDYLNRVTAADPELRAEVMSLLDAYARANDFIEEPAADLAASLMAAQLPFRRVGAYTIHRLLGVGGMGKVYLATDRLGRNVALKTLAARSTDDPQRVSRFLQEARAVLALNHPNIVTVYDIGEADGVYFISSELIEGETLRHAMDTRTFSLDTMLDIATQIATGIAAAHEKGIVHRDIKPENVMLRADGYVKVLDFGIAKLTKNFDDRFPGATSSSAVTREGLVIGTASYMSPEQARGAAVDERTDVWSFGVLLYEMLTGKLPFTSDSAAGVIALILERDPAPLADLIDHPPFELQQIVDRALDKDAQARFQTMSEIVSGLKALRTDIEFATKLGRLNKPVAEVRPIAGEPYVFICYAHADAARVQPFIEFLQAEGIKVWFDRGIRAGTVWRKAIADALDQSTHLVFFVSRESLASDHCDREVHDAIDNKKTIVPVFLERVDLTPSLRISLSRVQALYRDRMTEDGLRSELRAAIRTDTGTHAPIIGSVAKRSPRLRRSVAIGVAAFLAIAFAAVATWQYRDRTPVSLPTRSIAVLPFTVMSDESRLQHLADAVVEAVLNELTAQRQVRVASRADSSAKRADQTVPAFASAIGVSYVLEGGMRPSADGIRITAQLIRGSDGRPLLSRTFDLDRDAADLDGVASQLAVQAYLYADNDVRIAEARRQTTNDRAFAYWEQTFRLDPSGEEADTHRVGEDQALINIDKAIALDPDFAEPYRARAFIVSGGLNGRLNREETLREARKWIGRYLELKPDGLDGLTFLGNLQMAERDFAAAEKTYQRVREIDPQYPWTYTVLGELATRRGRLEEAADYFKQATLNDRARPSHWFYGINLLALGRFDEAAREFDIALHINPNDVESMVARAVTAYLLGHTDEARTRFDVAWARYGRTSPNDFVSLFARVGREQELRNLMKEWDAGTRPTSAGLRFLAHESLGETDVAIDWLLRSIDEHSEPAYLRAGGFWPEIRAHPRYREVLAKLDASEVSH
jgi:serine/threonine protein kinase/TolB-like protein/Tfp pilus assembly protein PilF